MTTHLVLLTAPSGAGKTTACRRLAACARENDLRAAGLLTLPAWQEDGHKHALWLHSLADGRVHLLAHVTAPASATLGIWRFLPTTLAWGRAVLRTLPPADVVIVDEIGPLELVHHHGLLGVAEALRRARPRLAVVTVRPQLANALVARLQPFSPRVLMLTPTNRDAIVTALCSEVVTVQPWENSRRYAEA